MGKRACSGTYGEASDDDYERGTATCPMCRKVVRAHPIYGPNERHQPPSDAPPEQHRMQPVRLTRHYP